ncbi:MAG TPA: YciI family protein [bacterium]|nr:YciI family protein [bacterium]
MRVMVLMPADKNSEKGILPDEKLIAGMVKYNEDLVKAGVMLAGEGLHPSSKGVRVRLSPTGKRTVIDGPFTEAKELIAGYWLWQVKSLEEAIEWVKRLPDYLERAGWTPPKDEGDYEIEVRPVFETEEFAAELSPELREQVTEQETRIREAAAKAKS